MTGSNGYPELAALTDEYLARLRAQLEDARAVAAVKQREAVAALQYVAKIESAVRSVEALQVSDVIVSIPSPREITAAEQELIDHFTKWSGESDTGSKEASGAPSSKLAPYVPVGGKRLKSKRMIFDLVKALGEPVTREQLRQQFFDYYGREELQRYWVRPDNALNTAIDRAVADQYILAVEAEGKPTTYTVGWEDTATGAPAFEDEEDD